MARTRHDSRVMGAAVVTWEMEGNNLGTLTEAPALYILIRESAHLANHPSSILQLSVAMRFVFEWPEAGGTADKGIGVPEEPPFVALGRCQVSM